jgi:hypothetical protein
MESHNVNALPEPAKTRLQEWLDANSFTSVQLEEATGITRPAMWRIRSGNAGPGITLRTMIRILRGACALAGRDVNMKEIFDLDLERSSPARDESPRNPRA